MPWPPPSQPTGAQVSYLYGLCWAAMHSHGVAGEGGGDPEHPAAPSWLALLTQDSGERQVAVWAGSLPAFPSGTEPSADFATVLVCGSMWLLSLTLVPAGRQEAMSALEASRWRASSVSGVPHSQLGSPDSARRLRLSRQLPAALLICSPQATWEA
ncbi:hypothetical protein P7K49_002187 [Saguinus oedipus]|uniref:Uncharacterized protein n=1 Tax=Saguinus oedipus TaxID=9490 RepID=A0ABQ9WHK2_SAGOE|nr:hypothetical protein P7K49_002187 [Saguinus oedipus]